MGLPRNLFTLNRLLPVAGQLAGGFVREWVFPAASFIQTPKARNGAASGGTGVASHPENAPVQPSPKALDLAANGPRGGSCLPTYPAQPIPPCGDPRNHAELIENARAASKYERARAQFYQRNFEMEC